MAIGVVSMVVFVLFHFGVFAEIKAHIDGYKINKSNAI